MYILQRSTNVFFTVNIEPNYKTTMRVSVVKPHEDVVSASAQAEDAKVWAEKLRNFVVGKVESVI